jgi:hypothetical protein
VSVPVILLIATTLIAAIWIADVFGSDISRWWQARRDLKRFKRQEKAHKELIKDCFAEHEMWEDRKLERMRRQREREERRGRAA